MYNMNYFQKYMLIHRPPSLRTVFSSTIYNDLSLNSNLTYPSSTDCSDEVLSKPTIQQTRIPSVMSCNNLLYYILCSTY